MHPSRILTLISNLIPLAGVMWWGWDVFQILVLYWMQTVLLVVWTLPHIAKLPAGALGDITVNGAKRAATHRDLLRLIGGTGLAFCAAHALFLWVLFSGEWSARVHGPVSFWHHMVIASGAWVALLMSVVSGAVSLMLTPPWSAAMRWIGRRVGLAEPAHAEDLGGIIAPMFGRVVLMQVAVIFGAFLAERYGSMAPLLILIGLKTLVDLSRHGPVGSFTVTSGTTSLRVGPR